MENKTSYHYWVIPRDETPQYLPIPMTDEEIRYWLNQPRNEETMTKFGLVLQTSWRASESVIQAQHSKILRNFNLERNNLDNEINNLERKRSNLLSPSDLRQLEAQLEGLFARLRRSDLEFEFFDTAEMALISYKRLKERSFFQKVIDWLKALLKKSV